MRKPRTVTGRIAARLFDAVAGPTPVRDRMSTRRDQPLAVELEYLFMLVAAQASQQGLDPSDFDNANGVDALRAIYTAVTDPDRAVIRVTSAWRRVVISARRLIYRPAPDRHLRRAISALRTSS